MNQLYYGDNLVVLREHVRAMLATWATAMDALAKARTIPDSLARDVLVMQANRCLAQHASLLDMLLRGRAIEALKINGLRKASKNVKGVRTGVRRSREAWNEYNAALQRRRYAKLKAARAHLDA